MATAISASTAALWVSPPPRALLCSICLDLFRDPSRTPCGHVFCRECVEEWLRHSNNGCPAPGCDARISCRELQRDEFARRLVGELVVRCQYHKIFSESGEEGCSWTGELSDLKDHLKTCGSVLERCAFLGCTEQPLPRWQLKTHEERCAYRPMTCARCGETFARCREEQHEETCPMAPVECPQRLEGCLATFPRRELLAHRGECPFEGVPCPNGGPLCATVRRVDLAAHVAHACTRIPCVHRRLGCKFQGRSGEVEAHVSRGSCAFEQMREYVTRNEEEKRRLREEVGSLRDDLALLRAQLQALAAAGAVPVPPLPHLPLHHSLAHPRAPGSGPGPGPRSDLSPPPQASPASFLAAAASVAASRARVRPGDPPAPPPYTPPSARPAAAAAGAVRAARGGAGARDAQALASLRSALEGGLYSALGPFAAPFEGTARRGGAGARLQGPLRGDRDRAAAASSAGDELSRDVPSLRPASRPSPLRPPPPPRAARAGPLLPRGSFLRSLAAAGGPGPSSPPPPASPSPRPCPRSRPSRAPAPAPGSPAAPGRPSPLRRAGPALAAPGRPALPLRGGRLRSAARRAVQQRRGGPQRVAGPARPAAPASASALLAAEWDELEVESRRGLGYPGAPHGAPVSVPVMRGGGSLGRSAAAAARRSSELPFSARPLSPPFGVAPPSPAPAAPYRPAAPPHVAPHPPLAPLPRRRRRAGEGPRPESPAGRWGGCRASSLARRPLGGPGAASSAFRRPPAARPAWDEGPDSDPEDDDEDGLSLGAGERLGDDEARPAPAPSPAAPPESPSGPAPRPAARPPPRGPARRCAPRGSPARGAPAAASGPSAADAGPLRAEGERREAADAGAGPSGTAPAGPSAAPSVSPMGAPGPASVYVSITFMDAYAGRSFEELRWEDAQLGRARGPSAPAPAPAQAAPPAQPLASSGGSGSGLGSGPAAAPGAGAAPATTPGAPAREAC
eukprot:tig00021518_g22042.t2